MLGLFDYPNLIDGLLVILGVILISIPTAGIVLVRPTSRNRVLDMLVCYLDSNNKYTGVGVYNTLQTGQSVTVAIRTGKHDCAILSQSNTNLGTWKNSPAFLIHNYTWTNPFYKTLFFLTLKALVAQLTRNRAWLLPNACPQDIFPGDYVVGDKSGGHLFIGRTLTTLKGGSLCSILLDAVNQKIVLLYNLKLDISLYSYLKQTPNASVKLRAACVELAAGTAYGLANDTYVNNKDVDGAPSILINNKRIPLFRHQQVLGSVYNGVYDLIVTHKSDLTQFLNVSQFMCLSALHKSYSGRLDSRGQRVFSAKTPFLKAPQSIEGMDKLSLLVTTNNFVLQLKTDTTADTLTSDRVLLTDLYISRSVWNSFTQELAGYMLLDCFYPYPDIGELDSIKWEDGQLKTPQLLAYPKHATITDKATGLTTKIFNSTSFIDQLLDGSICIKDGWGSLIRMVGGNIIISSALDTFIRPGRDCILMVPRYKLITADGPLVVASKQSVKLAAEKDVKIASASAGGIGCTVILNKSISPGLTSGIVIRSSSDMSITAANDMYIGLNDKTNLNAGLRTSKSSGSMIIDAGQTLTINSITATKIMAGLLEFYSYIQSLGAGLVLTPNRLSVTVRLVDLLSVVNIAQHSNGVSVLKLDESLFTLRGASTFAIQLNGPVDCSYAIARKGITSVGSIIGSTFATTNSTPQLQIYTLLVKGRQKILQQYGKLLQLNIQASLPVLQILPDCYSDDFVYAQELRLIGSDQYAFSAYKMPGVCWQQLRYKPNGISFLPVMVILAGLLEPSSYTYPGYQAWTSFGTISTVVDGLIEEKRLIGNYKTNTEEQILEDSGNGSN